MPKTIHVIDGELLRAFEALTREAHAFFRAFDVFVTAPEGGISVDAMVNAYKRVHAAANANNADEDVRAAVACLRAIQVGASSVNLPVRDKDGTVREVRRFELKPSTVQTSAHTDEYRALFVELMALKANDAPGEDLRALTGQLHQLREQMRAANV